jgi:hypothetical protein
MRRIDEPGGGDASPDSNQLGYTLCDLLDICRV